MAQFHLKQLFIWITLWSIVVCASASVPYPIWAEITAQLIAISLILLLCLKSQNAFVTGNFVYPLFCYINWTAWLLSGEILFGPSGGGSLRLLGKIEFIVSHPVALVQNQLPWKRSFRMVTAILVVSLLEAVITSIAIYGCRKLCRYWTGSKAVKPQGHTMS